MWADLWKPELLFEVFTFLWKLLNDGLTERRESANRNLITDASCPLCAIEEGCLDRLFIAYNLACAMCLRSCSPLEGMQQTHGEWTLLLNNLMCSSAGYLAVWHMIGC